jgi:hypothetical protein
MCAVLVLESTHKNIGLLGFLVTSGSIQAISYLLHASVEPQPLGRNRWAATVAPVDHAVTSFSIKPFLKRFAIKPFFEKACDK